ncbi:rhodanese-like domain-containing protein [Rubellimicrobium roseum]|uniref:Rhodanese domain-containing protein n=1 Tax=Rubellimicrobium roseum TaxID=687525 RepID=A0A5C4NBR1_9RHOB|nr:rhodanese-like domain-containing protein [Rubellimicrobium roseum]TNC71370.1 hypothetical protein FHG71_11480 [Rubellimicrobium roseum]
MYLAPVDGPEAMRLLANGALVVDIRDEEERSRLHIPGSIHASVNRPLLPIQDEVPAVVFHCSCGRRAEDNAYRLKDLTTAPAYMLRGGLDAWVENGLPVVSRGGLSYALRQHGHAVVMGLVALGGALVTQALSPAVQKLSMVVGLR